MTDTLRAALERIEQDAGWLHNNVPDYTPDGVATLRDIAREIAKEASQARAALQGDAAAPVGGLAIYCTGACDACRDYARELGVPLIVMPPAAATSSADAGAGGLATEDAEPLSPDEEAVVRGSLTGPNVLPPPFVSLPRVHYDRGLVRRLIATLDAARESAGSLNG